MIEQYVGKTNYSTPLPVLMDFVNKYRDSDLYLTSDNQRYSITNSKLLNKLVKESHTKFIDLDNDNNVHGLILIWKSRGDVNRHYVKLVADSKESAIKLLTQINWSVAPQLFIKINKQSKFLNAFQSKGFRFIGGRGTQLLLRRDKAIIPVFKRDKDEEQENANDRNFSKYRTPR